MLLDHFQEYIRKNHLCTKEDKVLLTVSGGVDSMVMMSLFVASGYTVGVAHCNFQLRGEEAEEDEVLVEQQAAQANIPCYNKRFDTLHEMQQSGGSVQMVARRLRYAWFDELCREHGYTHIAIAHHGDDSVETFFINLLRGTGLRGLTGINVINGRLIRPLLFATRREITDYALAKKVPYREDSSNASTKYLRNKIRLGIVPRIKEVSPRFTETMTANVERLTDAQHFIDRGIEILRQWVITEEGDNLTIELSKLDPQLPRNFVLFELLNRYGFHGETIESLCQSLSAQGCGKRFYAKDRVAYIDRDRILITPIPHEDACAIEVSNTCRKVSCGSGLLHFDQLDIDDIDQLHQPKNIALLNADKVHFPLTVRRWQEGDSLIPLGMSGRKKVSDLLIDEKVSMPEKQRQFVVCSGSDILWVVGRRIDERYRIDSATEYVLRITQELI